ncbi:acyclic terpene utilization AtuA family protein, partial [Burkholderia gladioli]|nr:acyclic terpene utilization AtuA family protein [Burkholderia gladioli]
MTASASASTSAPSAPAGRRVRLGAGAGYSGDRIEPAVELAEHGALDYLVFECLADMQGRHAELAGHLGDQRQHAEVEGIGIEQQAQRHRQQAQRDGDRARHRGRDDTGRG